MKDLEGGWNIWASTHTNQGNNSSYNIFTLKLLGNW